jgi:uncharacterized membrane protein YkvI
VEQKEITHFHCGNVAFVTISTIVTLILILILILILSFSILATIAAATATAAAKKCTWYTSSSNSTSYLFASSTLLSTTIGATASRKKS